MSFLYKRLVKLAEIASKKELEENLSSKKLKYIKTISSSQQQTNN